MGEEIFAIDNHIKYIFLYDPRYDKMLFVTVKKLLLLSFLAVLPLELSADGLDPAKALRELQNKIKKDARKSKAATKRYENRERTRKRSCDAIKSLAISQKQRIVLSKEWRVPMKTIRFIKSEYKTVSWSGFECFLYFDTAYGIKEVRHSFLLHH